MRSGDSEEEGGRVGLRQVKGSGDRACFQKRTQRRRGSRTSGQRF